MTVNKPYKIDPINNLSQSFNSSDLEDSKDYLPPSKKLKRANAIITLDACDMVELDTILKYIFANFIN